MAVLEDLRMKTGELLDEGLNTGALTAEEHSWRRGHLSRADSVEALEALVEDLLVPDSGSGGPLVRNSSQVTLLSSRTFQVGDLGRRSEVVTLLGSSVIDLSSLDSESEMTIELVSVLGDTTVSVPAGMQVNVECTPVLGDCHVAPGLQSRDAGVRITGVVVMGSLRVIPAKGVHHG